MANNQNVNKVVYGGDTLIDLTSDDVTAGDVLSRKKFHLPSGAEAIGTLEPISLGLTGASVGDLVRVNAVDSNGKPTSWKHVPLNEIKCNKNLLDNWYFVGGGSQQGGGQFPINQRGQTVYGGAGYGIDRWWWWNTTDYTLNTAGLALGAETYIAQKLNQALSSNLVGKIVTMSFLTANNILLSSTFVWESAKDNTLYGDGVNLIAGDASPGFSMDYPIFVIKTMQAPQIIKAVKLEHGSEQTLAHNEGTEESPVWVLNEIPDYGEELRKCQRYYCRIPQYVNFLKVYEDAGFTDIIVNVPVPMRGYPSTAGLISGLTINTCISDPLNTTALRFRLNGTTTDPVPYVITTLEISADL